MKNIIVVLITFFTTTASFAVDKYYSNSADEAKGKIEYSLLQREVHQTAKQDQQRRKKMNAREGEIILTNDEIDQRLDLLSRFVTHPESRKAIDFVNNAKTDPYKTREVTPVNMEGFYFDPNPQREHPEFKGYGSGNGEVIPMDQLFNPNLGRQK